MSGGGDGLGRIDVGSLLTIDVASELRKLSQAQLQGPWQIPAEFVRRALRHGAREVDVELGRHRARVSDDSRGVPAAALSWTATLLDPRCNNAERHQALTALEAAGELALLATAGLPPSQLLLRSRSRGVLHTLSWDGQRAALASGADPGPDRCEIELHAAGLERRACHDWLADATRFASASVRVDGKLVPIGFAHAFAHVELQPPLRGRLGIPTEGETAHAWLLEHGMVSGHVAIPEAPCFEAAVELGSDSHDGSAARLREALQPLVIPLVNQAMELLLRLAAQAAALPEPARARLARLLLQGARKQLRQPEVARARILRAIDGAGEKLVDLATLQTAAHRGDGETPSLLAIYPDQRADGFAIGDALVLVADETERSLVAELLSVRFRAPDARESRGRLSSLLLRARERVGEGLGQAAQRLRHPFMGRVLEDDTLHDEERNLLEQLRAHLHEDPQRSCDSISMCAGAGPIRRTRGVLLLPRRNPIVAASVRALASDPAWAYPACLALLVHHARAPERLRRAWLRGGASS
ncbi:MAG: hypothetical protein K1X88_23025 [Nannocystaceae bacterium]|nr:hypothetical protein [Nannocystaceae bacterium]